MNNNLTIGLEITVIGIVLVFVGILVLWGMMELLVRVTTKRSKPNPKSESLQDTTQEISLKQKAAAVAVGVALSLPKTKNTPLTSTQTADLSPWQSYHRGQNYQIIKKK